MADQTDLTARQRADRRLQGVLTAYNRIDGVVFTVEAAIVSAATALMTAFVFLDIVFTFANGVRVRLFTEAGRAGGLEQGRLFALILSALLVVALIVAGVRAHPRLGRSGRGTRLTAVAVITGIVAVFILLLVKAHPRTTCLALVALGALYALVRVRARMRAGRYGLRALAVWALAFALLTWFATTVPDRYSSWTQPYALFLLLWTGFIGASMATSRGRHLKIDAVRKALKPTTLARYNVISYLLAAGFTAILCYLSVRYTFARFGTVHTAGEIPDWLKVLAIPFSLFIISLRFAGRALLSALGHVEAAGELVRPPDAREAE